MRAIANEISNALSPERKISDPDQLERYDDEPVIEDIQDESQSIDSEESQSSSKDTPEKRFTGSLTLPSNQSSTSSHVLVIKKGNQVSSQKV